MADFKAPQVVPVKDDSASSNIATTGQNSDSTTLLATDTVLPISQNHQSNPSHSDSHNLPDSGSTDQPLLDQPQINQPQQTQPQQTQPQPAQRQHAQSQYAQPQPNKSQNDFSQQDQTQGADPIANQAVSAGQSHLGSQNQAADTLDNFGIDDGWGSGAGIGMSPAGFTQPPLASGGSSQAPGGFPAPSQGGNWGSSWGGAAAWNDPWAAPQNTGGQQQKRLTPQERVEMIERVYQQVLARKPDTRDINYYKYSTLGEEDIRRQLFDGKEYKQLLEDGRNYKKVEERVEQAEARVRLLEGQIKDQIEEFRNLTQLLEEKNRYIQRLRSENNIQYGFKPPESIGGSQQVYDHTQTTNISVPQPLPSQQHVEMPSASAFDTHSLEKDSYNPSETQVQPESSSTNIGAESEQLSSGARQQFSAPGAVESPDAGFAHVEESQDGQLPISENSEGQDTSTPEHRGWASNEPNRGSMRKFLDKFVSIVSPDQ